MKKMQTKLIQFQTPTKKALIYTQKIQKYFLTYELTDSSIDPCLNTC